MKSNYLQTVVIGCAWCKKTINISTKEVDIEGEKNFVLISHGMCVECKKEFDFEGNEEKSEELFCV